MELLSRRHNSCLSLREVLQQVSVWLVCHLIGPSVHGRTKHGSLLAPVTVSRPDDYK